MRVLLANITNLRPLPHVRGAAAGQLSGYHDGEMVGRRSAQSDNYLSTHVLDPRADQSPALGPYRTPCDTQSMRTCQTASTGFLAADRWAQEPNGHSSSPAIQIPPMEMLVGRELSTYASNRANVTSCRPHVSGANRTAYTTLQGVTFANPIEFRIFRKTCAWRSSQARERAP